MRNIKTMLRNSRNSALLFAAASGLLYLTACSSEVNYNNGDQDVPETPASKASFSVFSGNQSRVHNFGTSATRATAADFGFEMPECPEVPEGAKDLADPTVYNNGDPAANGNYVVKSGSTLNLGIKLKGINIYVENGASLSFEPQSGTTGGNIYVLPGGTLITTNYLHAGVSIYNYGTISTPYGLGMGAGSKLYSAVDMILEGDVTVNGASADNADLSAAELYCVGSITVTGTVMINGKTSACAYISESNMTFNDAGTIYTSYFKANLLKLRAASIVLKNNGLIDAETLFLSNEDTRIKVEQGGSKAVVAARNFLTNNKEWPKYQFEYPVVTDFKSCGIGNEYWASPIDVTDLELQVSNGGETAKVSADVCHPAYGTTTNPDPENPDPTTPDEPVKDIVKITEIDPLDEEINHGNHDHGIISATCINFGPDGTAYASYHLRGNGKDSDKNPNYIGEYAQKGCIEVIRYDEAGKFSLGSYMIANDWDFNHIIVDGNRIVTVGNAKKKGAFVGSLPVDFGSSEGVSNEFTYKELTTAEAIYGDIQHKDGSVTQGKVGYKNAGDGNCIVRQGDYYYVATYEGYGPINLDFSKVKNEAGDVVFKKTNGSAKHISINGGNMAVLALDSYDKTSSTASVYKFGADDYSFANVLGSYDAVGTVSPVDGKNVVAIDGNDIYACLSKGGLVRLSDGKTFQRGNNVPVNGMAFDDKYVYVANGSFIDVLNKSDLSRVCHYHAANEKSANYIALRNGKIYAAFGENGIQVFQLVEKEISAE